MTKIKYILSALVLFLTLPAGAQVMPEVRFGNEAADTTRITELIDGCVAAGLRSPEERVAYLAMQFVGIPYAAHTLEGEPEMLTVRMDSLDCTTFAETMLALAQTAGDRRHSWRDFVYNLRRLRYRNGEINGYPSRLHYNAEWAVDNIHRGNLKDATNLFPKISYVVRNIDFMSRHRDSYPALADSANFARVRSTESGFRNHRFPYVKTGDLGNRAVREAFHSGDVVALVASNVPGLDVTHMGIVIRDEAGELHLLHASLSKGRVSYEDQPLQEFMRKNRQWLGMRVFRLDPGW